MSHMHQRLHIFTKLLNGLFGFLIKYKNKTLAYGIGQIGTQKAVYRAVPLVRSGCSVIIVCSAPRCKANVQLMNSVSNVQTSDTLSHVGRWWWWWPWRWGNLTHPPPYELTQHLWPAFPPTSGFPSPSRL